MYLIASDAGIEREYVNPSKAYLDSLTIDSQQILLCVLVGGVILLACVLVIYGVFYLSVIGRIHQFGQLRTIGMTKKQLKKFVSREGRLLFLRSVPIGIVIGGVAGYSRGNIENCSVSGSVSGNRNSDGTDNCVGGVVGQQFDGSITGCSSSTIVEGMGGVGGVAGKTANATLTACYATEDVTVERTPTNNTYAGGVVGSNFSSTLIACYATGSVTGTGTGTGPIYVGGVTGDNASGTLTACYHAKGAVKGPNGTTGGVAGRNYNAFVAPVITACYWGSNGQEQGIGENQAGTTGGTEQVTDGDWQNAVTQMNAALSGKGWQYELKDGNSLPALKKEQ